MVHLESLAALVQVSHGGDPVSLLVPRLSRRKNDLSRYRVANLPKDESKTSFVLMMLCPLVLQGCHAGVPCHLEFRGLFMLDRFHWGIVMEQCVPWYEYADVSCVRHESPPLERFVVL